MNQSNQDDNLTVQNPATAIVFVADQVGANMLPPYGNTLVDTPNLNQLAAESMLFDQAISDSPDLMVGLRSLWYPTHAARKEQGGDPHLAGKLASLGCESILLTDDDVVAESPLAEEFDRVIQLECEPVVSAAKTIGDTWLAKFFAQAIELARNLEPGSLLWIHCRTLNGPWDAPYEFRQRLADSEDPDPPTFVEPPLGYFDSDVDSPDIQLGYQQASAAQILLLDECLGVLIDVVKTLNNPTLFSFFSTRGYPLGEHGPVGSTNNLFSESIHVPLMVRWPDLRFRAYRVQSLVQLNSVYHLILRWFANEDETMHGYAARVLPDKSTEVACSVFENQQAIQTHAWKLIRDPGNENRFRLFKKPDDRWEANDVHDRCPQIVPKLEEFLDHCLNSLGSSEPNLLHQGAVHVPIPDELAFEM